MTVKAAGTNSPLDQRTEDDLKRRDDLTARYAAEEMSTQITEPRAQREMGDWRRG